VLWVLTGLFGWRIWPHQLASLLSSSKAEAVQQVSVPSKPDQSVANHRPDEPSANLKIPKQSLTSTPAKQQECQTGSICNQDSSVNAPQTVIDKSQSAVRIDSNGGEISGTTVNGAAVIGPDTGDHEQSLVHLKSAPGLAIRNVTIQDAYLCNFPTWDDYLDCIVTYPPGAEGLVEDYRRAAMNRLAELKYPLEVANKCLEAIDDANKQLIGHESDELETIAYLQAHRPFCLTPRKQ
jgi:Tfp pilus assembly protein FimT